MYFEFKYSGHVKVVSHMLILWVLITYVFNNPNLWEKEEEKEETITSEFIPCGCSRRRLTALLFERRFSNNQEALILKTSCIVTNCKKVNHAKTKDISELLDDDNDWDIEDKRNNKD